MTLNKYIIAASVFENLSLSLTPPLPHDGGGGGGRGMKIKQVNEKIWELG